MQISYSNLIASQQQAVRAPARPVQPATSQPAPAFEPIAFKQAATKAVPAPAETAQSRPPTSTGPVRPGTHLDIKV